MILKIDTLNQQAYDILKEKILNKELLPGTRLVDSQLAEDFGISRTPLRDAIRKLAEEGFVVSSPTKKGYYVYQPSAKDINEIFELRQILVAAAGGDAAESSGLMAQVRIDCLHPGISAQANHGIVEIFIMLYKGACCRFVFCRPF